MRFLYYFPIKSVFVESLKPHVFVEAFYCSRWW